MEAEARELKSKVLKPLQAEFEALEAKIAELEATQASLTKKLSDPAIVNDGSRFRQTTNEVEKTAKALETSYFRWGQLSDEIEKLNNKLGITGV